VNDENTRPWGRYEVLLDEDYCKVKRIFVNPGHRLSYQYHHNRNEIWAIVKGKGKATLNDDDRLVKEGNVILIPANSKHRIENNSKEELIFIEVQQGTYFGEDDIVRLDDDYERA